MADVRPFRAVRYARPDVSQTAPPYDVIDDSAGAELRARDPHNVVHLTLEPDAEAAGERDDRDLSTLLWVLRRTIKTKEIAP